MGYSFSSYKGHFGAFNSFGKCTLSLRSKRQQLLQRLKSEVKLYILKKVLLSLHITVYICICRSGAKCQDKTGGVFRLSASQISIFHSPKSNFEPIANILCSSMKTHHLSTRTQLSSHTNQDQDEGCVCQLLFKIKLKKML